MFKSNKKLNEGSIYNTQEKCIALHEEDDEISQLSLGSGIRMQKVPDKFLAFRPFRESRDFKSINNISNFVNEHNILDRGLEDYKKG